MKETIVGVVFFVGLGLLGYFTIYVKGGVTSSTTASGFTYKVNFKSVAGLERGQKVKVSGMDVGKVTALKLLPSGQIEATLSTWQEIPFKQDYKVVIKDVSPLGGKYVDIEPGEESAALEVSAATLVGSSRASLLAEGGDLISEIRVDAKKIFESLREITENIAGGRGTLGKLYKQGDLYDDLLAAVKDLRMFAEKLNSPSGTIGKLLTQPELYDRLNSAVANLDKIITGVKDGKGSMGKLFNETHLYDDLRAALNKIDKFVSNVDGMVDHVKAGKGSLGRLYVNPEAYDNVTGTFKEARQMLEKLRRGEGTLGRLLQDDSLYESLRSVAVDLKAITGDLRQGRGTLGKLLQDDTLYRELRNVILEVGRAVEDTREQAPITTFTSVIFNVF